MKNVFSGIYRLSPVILILLLCFSGCRKQADSGTGKVSGKEILIGRLETSGIVRLIPSEDGRWGIEVQIPGKASVKQSKPAKLQTFKEQAEIKTIAAGYSSVRKTANGFIGQADITGPDGAVLHFKDEWTIAGPVLSVDRLVTVKGNSPAGFLTAIKFQTDNSFAFPDLEYFAPGRIYGGPQHLLETAPAGMLNFRAGSIEIREDWLPMPVFGIYFRDGSSLAVLNPNPRGDTTSADGTEPEGKTLIDQSFQFGALGGSEITAGGIELGYWFPGTVSRTAKNQNQNLERSWRSRYHPIKDNFTHQYTVAFRFGTDESFHDFYRNAWRWGWAALKPKVNFYDIEQVRRCLLDTLAGQVETIDGRTGIGFWVDSDAKPAVAPENWDYWQKGMTKAAIMGFCGKNLESAAYLLEDSYRKDNPRGEEYRKLALAIFDSFVKLKMSPLYGEGFYIDTGKPAYTVYRSDKAFLRSFTEDMTMMMWAIEREKNRGQEHPDWLGWCREFSDWLLTQQRPDGSIPRCWQGGTGAIIDAAPESSYNAVLFWSVLSKHTGDKKYMDAAIRAADYCWVTDQANDQFVGGTLDNPNITDKEAGSLSMEAYLYLYKVTGENKWLQRAIRAADFAETWIFAWNVPMPADANDAELHWKKGVSTVGVNLINSTGSGVDQWLAYNADDYARLYVLTKDSHYLDVARILLHNTKNMLAIPGRTYDLRGPGWQQEHWSLGSHRGFGGHRWWLPWVTTSHLNGIFGLDELDTDIIQKLGASKNKP